jgi:DNA (cytosine-5)-methyltransferase 1
MGVTVLEICAGGGGQALGLELAGFEHAAAVEYEAQFCETLRRNRPKWNVLNEDVREFSGSPFRGVDLLAGGVPCPPFSVAGKQLGPDDDRDMFPAALDLVESVRPRAVLFENVPGFASRKFEVYRQAILDQLKQLGYRCQVAVLEAADFGVPQLRPRCLIVGFLGGDEQSFTWPTSEAQRVWVGDTLRDLMASKGWKGADRWSERAVGIAPTVVGGSKKHGGPDLGPTRAKTQWLKLGVDGRGIANEAPDPSFEISGIPRLTLRMVARIQSFPDSWEFFGGKTVAYRQIGNAFPPLVARAVGIQLIKALNSRAKRRTITDQSSFNSVAAGRAKRLRTKN